MTSDLQACEAAADTLAQIRDLTAALPGDLQPREARASLLGRLGAISSLAHRGYNALDASEPPSEPPKREQRPLTRRAREKLLSLGITPR